MLGVRITQTPIVVDIPKARIDAVDGSEQDPDCLGRRTIVHAIDAQGGVEQDSGDVFSAVEQVGELVSRVFVTSEALQQSPYTR